MATAQSAQEKFQNKILLMRHGYSESNVQRILVTNPKDGISSYGLTEKGKQQASEACEVLRDILSECSAEDPADKIVLISSDFKRARETAEIVHENFNIKTALRMDPRLRDRDMGNLDKHGSQALYDTFPRDKGDPTHTDNGVESVTNMATRMTHAVTDIDKEFRDKVIVVISHKEPLMTLYAVSHGESPGERYDKFEFITNCEIREIKCLQYTAKNV